MDYKKFEEFEKRALNSVYSELPGGFHDALIIQVVNHVMPEFKINLDATIIDIGCGPGIFAKVAKPLGYSNITGITLSQEDVDECINNGLKAIYASMSDLPYSDNSIDFIWCRHAIEHSPYPLFTLYEFHRVLKSGGKAFIEVPAPNNERYNVHEFNPNHYSIMGDRMWQALFEKAQFKTFAFWNSEIDLPFEVGPFKGKIVKETSFMFGIEKI